MYYVQKETESYYKLLDLVDQLSEKFLGELDSVNADEFEGIVFDVGHFIQKILNNDLDSKDKDRLVLSIAGMLSLAQALMKGAFGCPDELGSLIFQSVQYLTGRLSLLMNQKKLAEQVQKSMENYSKVVIPVKNKYGDDGFRACIVSLLFFGMKYYNDFYVPPITTTDSMEC